MKTLKFRQYLVPLILSGEKTSTWRLFDDKDLTVGDELEFLVKETGEPFARATIVKVIERPLGQLNEDEIEGHEKYSTPEEMYKTFSDFYKTDVGPDTPVKVIWFKLEL